MLLIARTCIIGPLQSSVEKCVVQELLIEQWSADRIWERLIVMSGAKRNVRESEVGGSMYK
jgi:hypothetical protein